MVSRGDRFGEYPGRDPSAFTSGRKPRTTEIHRFEPTGSSAPYDGKRGAQLTVTVRGAMGRDGSKEPLRIG